VLIGNWYEDLEASRQGDRTAATLMGYGGRFDATTTSRATYTTVSSGTRAPNHSDGHSLTTSRHCWQLIQLQHDASSRQGSIAGRPQQSTETPSAHMTRHQHNVPGGLGIPGSSTCAPKRHATHRQQTAPQACQLQKLPTCPRYCSAQCMWIVGPTIHVGVWSCLMFALPNSITISTWPPCLLLQGPAAGSVKQSTGTADTCVPAQLKFSHGDPAAPPVQCFATMNQLALGTSWEVPLLVWRAIQETCVWLQVKCWVVCKHTC
jgi:hypothetical protein